MIIFSIVVVQWGCVIGAVIDLDYDAVGIIIFAFGLSFDSLIERVSNCNTSDADTAFELHEGLAAQVTNWTFTLGSILTVYFIQNGEQMPIYDGIRLAMVLLSAATVALYLWVDWIQNLQASQVLGCLMVEFGIVVSLGLVYVVHEKPDFHMTWN